MADLPPPSPAAPLLSLQVLRAVAALMVVVHHAAYDADAVAARAGTAAFDLERWFDLAFGIHLFFVISGFIMLRTARGFGSGRGAAVFMARRIVRVVPLYWLMTSLVLVGAAVAPALLNAPPGGPAVVLGSYLFVPVARASGEVRPVLGQGWTLNYEMFFYVLFALAMLLPRRAGLAGLALGMVGLVGVGWLALPSVAAVAVWTDGLLLEFLFGLGLGLARERGWRLGGRQAAAAVAVGAAAAIGFGGMDSRFDDVALWLREGVPAALVVAGCVLGPRWRASRLVLALALVGDASYSLYLSHPFAIRLVRTAWLAWVPARMPAIAFLGLSVIAAVGASLTLYRAVERPMTRWLGRHMPLARSVARPILPDAAAREA